MAALVRRLQDEICAALERVDGGGARFREDAWTREGGGGGVTRVLESGAVFEKAGVNHSVVSGDLGGRATYAAGLSLVLHPRSPMVPTVHANFRYLEKGDADAWFGGGADLTPYYLFEEDVRHFHAAWKAASGASYRKWKKACDEYFYLPHRREARGVGGIFFERDADFAAVERCANAFLGAYLPIVERRRALAYGEPERFWQEVRRGRYVEFNLLYDRGTAFGLESGGRTESILMSLPPRVRWVYAHEPAPGSEEARLLEVLRNPREWV